MVVPVKPRICHSTIFQENLHHDSLIFMWFGKVRRTLLIAIELSKETLLVINFVKFTLYKCIHICQYEPGIAIDFIELATHFCLSDKMRILFQYTMHRMGERAHERTIDEKTVTFLHIAVSGALL